MWRPTVGVDDPRMEQHPSPERISFRDSQPRTRPALLAVAASCLFFVTTIVGGLSGFVVTFGACFKQTCSDAEANAWAIGLFGGMVVGGAAIALAISKRAWLYRHPGLLWIPPGVVGAAVGLLLVAGALD